MSDVESVESFRLRARTWLAENMERGAAAWSPGPRDEAAWAEHQRSLQRRVFDGGFAGVMYPVEYGGLGLTRAHQRAFKEEATPYIMPFHYSVTHGILGPTLLDFGTEEQKRTYIPAMLAGDLWVQLLSEPSGGSDMAGVLTRATRDGDTYVLNGAKIWSTGAHIADYSMALCRTNWDVPKHRGLSMIILPLRHPGVTVQPIKLVDGSAHFCQEFIDDAVVPAENLVGQEDDGWTVASRLLFHERSMMGGVSLDDTPMLGGRRAGSGDSLDELARLAKRVGKADDPVVRQKIGEGMVLDGLRPYAAARIEAGMRSGRIAGPGAAMLKLMTSLVMYRRAELAFEIAGPHALAWQPEDTHATTGIRYIAGRAGTVAGGSSEMQRNQIAERVLGLPREASPGKDLPFNQTLHNSAR
jgi:alkylation response protein AidB-like acyl-CoA dehydrogenase